jgi:hypothetical protein
VLNLGGTYHGRYVQLVLLKTNDWSFVDEIDFNAMVTDQPPPLL